MQQAVCNVQRATCAPHERGEAFIFLLCEQSQHLRGSRPHHQLIIDHGDANANANGRSALEAATLPSPRHPLLPSPLLPRLPSVTVIWCFTFSCAPAITPMGMFLTHVADRERDRKREREREGRRNSSMHFGQHFPRSSLSSLKIYQLIGKL